MGRLPAFCIILFKLSRFSLAFNHFDETNSVAAALVNQQVFIPRHPHVTDDADARRNLPTLKGFCGWVESDQRIRPLPRLVVPNNVIDHSDGVGVGFGAAR